MELNLKDRKKLTQVTAKRYQKAKRQEKSKILDTFTGQTGYERKYAIHLLANEGKTKYIGRNVKAQTVQGSRKKRVYKKVYDEAVRDALIPLWLAFNCLCGKILKPFLQANLERICSNPRFSVPQAVYEKLGRISAATIDRLLRKTKQKMRIKGTSGTKSAAYHLKSLIPVMSHFECKEQGAGLWQIDLVQHDGGNPGGEFCSTLTVTEITSCWTVHYTLKNKAFKWVYEALDAARSLLPIPVRILHSDNGSEFINHALLHWCNDKGISLTRSRTNRKNDNCFVEQKNYASVRKIVGYGRFSGDRGIAALQAVYSSYDKLLNFFYPSQKLIAKVREGSKIKKTYDKPQPPFDRALAHPDLPQSFKTRLSAAQAAIDLMAEMELMQRAIDKLPSLADPVPEFVSKRTLKPLLFGSYG
jgi:transposase InsO family protein